MPYNYKSARSSLQGRINRDNGEEFENLIMASCEFYRKNGIAMIEKTPEPFRVTRNLGKGQFVGYFTKQAQPDFKGVMTGGKMIAFDAKVTVTDKIPVSALTETQLDDLLQYALLGAEAGVLMCFGFTRFIWLDILVFVQAKGLNGHKYWTADEAATGGKEVKFTGTHIMFLE